MRIKRKNREENLDQAGFGEMKEIIFLIFNILIFNIFNYYKQLTNSENEIVLLTNPYIFIVRVD